MPAGAWVGTFHGICLRLLKRFHREAGLRKNFKVLDAQGQRELFSTAGITWESDDGDLVDIIGKWKDSLVSPDEAEADAVARGNSVLRTAAGHYRTYEEAIKTRGDLDFSDLVVKSLALLTDSPEVQSFIAGRIRHVLVDEFQDVNKSQVLFLQAFASCGSAVWAVADDDQALYGWRGGNVRYTVNFSHHFPGAKSYTLTLNYRCDPAIIAAANSVIRNNKERVRKTLLPSKAHRPGVCVRIRGFKSEREEAEWIAAALERYMKAGAKLSDAAVLFRTSSVSPAIQQALETRNVPFSLAGTQSFWDLPEVAALAELLLAIEEKNQAKGSRFKKAWDIVQTMGGASPSETAVPAARLIGDQPPAGVNGERAALWADACDAAAIIAAGFPSAREFAAHVAEKAGKASGGDAEGVALSTIHSAKGLEWKHVFIAGCEASLMPHQKSDDQEEERRLFYVALTRSKGSVDATWSRHRFGRSQRPSQFLSEMNSAPKGAVIWGEGNDDSGSAAAHARPSAPAAHSRKTGGFTVYRKRGGGRSLIPPGEED